MNSKETGVVSSDDLEQEDELSEESRKIEDPQEAPWHIKWVFVSESLAVIGMRLLLIALGIVILFQIITWDIKVLELIQNLFELTVQHEKMGFLAFAAAFYFLAKSILSIVDQAISNKY